MYLLSVQQSTFPRRIEVLNDLRAICLIWCIDGIIPKAVNKWREYFTLGSLGDL